MLENYGGEAGSPARACEVVKSLESVVTGEGWGKEGYVVSKIVDRMASHSGLPQKQLVRRP